jgi:catalase
VFQPGTRTETLIRFSTVAGERGSPDTWRDPRGFSLRLYTSEGNLDIVGNNTPVFFIRDAMKFQHFIRSQKRRADNNLRDNDMQWDFWTLSPETAHQVAWLFGDRGIPATWRQMHGYGSHTYSWINVEGQIHWVKYHFLSDQGVQCLTQDEADRLVSVDGDYHTRDLHEAIKRGDYPSWTLKMQIMPFDDAKTYRFNFWAGGSAKGFRGKGHGQGGHRSGDHLPGNELDAASGEGVVARGGRVAPAHGRTTRELKRDAGTEVHE